MRLSNWKLKALFTSLAAVAAVATLPSGRASAQLVTVAEDSFESLHTTMQPFTEAINIIADGTDFTNQIRTGTARVWTVDNSQMGNPAGSAAGGVCAEPAFNGWTAMDVTSWTAEQGPQIGRTSLGLATRNTALVADPDAYYDFDAPAQPGGAYNGYIYRDYDLTGFAVGTTRITFDYEFAYEAAQKGVVEVSFDGGTTYQPLLVLEQIAGVPANDTIATGPVTYVAGTDFTPSGNQMRLRIGCINAGNNWWFAVDNVLVETVETTPFSDLEDFEGLTMGPFTVATAPTTPKYDGTDWTNVIPNWTIDNSNMLGESLELGFDGWAALDVKCWVNEQSGQGRSIFDLFDFNLNACLVADGDAFYDYDVDFSGTGPAPANGMNTYISRTYDLDGFDVRDLKISIEYECRVENSQRGTIEASFDNGATWIELRDLIADPANGIPNDAYLIEAAEIFAGVGFTPPVTATSMILRIGYLEADNNWWFAVDNVKIEAPAINYVIGDANGDGSFDFGDIEAFFLAITDSAAYAAMYPGINPDAVLDFDGDGVASFGDIEAFFTAVTGG